MYKLQNNPKLRKIFYIYTKIEWVLHMKCFHEANQEIKIGLPFINFVILEKWADDDIVIFVSKMEGF